MISNKNVEMFIIDILLFFTIFLIFRAIKKYVIMHLQNVCPHYIYNSKLHALAALCMSAITLSF